MQGRRAGHLSSGFAKIVRGREVTIRSLEAYAVEVQVDGDCILETPLSCRVSQRTLQLRAPMAPSRQNAG